VRVHVNLSIVVADIHIRESRDINMRNLVRVGQMLVSFQDSFVMNSRSLSFEVYVAITRLLIV
jgi:hypothetical protein